MRIPWCATKIRQWESQEGHKDAYRMLKQLSGKTILFVSGVAIVLERKAGLFHEETSVTFYA